MSLQTVRLQNSIALKSALFLSYKDLQSSHVIPTRLNRGIVTVGIKYKLSIEEKNVRMEYLSTQCREQ